MATLTLVRASARTARPTNRLTIAGVIAGSVLAFLLARHHLIDDTYITLSYARNLAFHGHWGLLADGTSNTATSPLNVVLLAGLTVVVRDAVVATGLLYVACQVLLLLALRRLGAATGLPRWFPALTVGALTVNPLLLSSIGLEVTLGAAGLAWLLAFAGARHQLGFGLTAGSLVLVRVDLALFVVVIFLARRVSMAEAVRGVFGAVMVAGPWFLFSWVALGSAVPDTLVIKTLQGAQRAWGGWEFGNGPALYWSLLPWPTVLSFLPIAVAVGFAVVLGLRLLVAVRDRPDVGKLAPFAALALSGAVYCAAYDQLRVPPYHWYYGPGIVAGTVFSCAVAAWHARGADRRAGGPASVKVVALGIVMLIATASVVNYAASGLPRAFAPITSNYTSSAQYAEIGRQIGRLVGDRTVGSAGEIGVLAYTCDCAIIDVFSDRGRLAEAVAAREETSGRMARGLVRANYAFLDDRAATKTRLRARTDRRPSTGAGNRPLEHQRADVRPARALPAPGGGGWSRRVTVIRPRTGRPKFGDQLGVLTDARRPPGQAPWRT